MPTVVLNNYAGNNTVVYLYQENLTTTATAGWYNQTYHPGRWQTSSTSTMYNTISYDTTTVTYTIMSDDGYYTNVRVVDPTPEEIAAQEARQHEWARRAAERSDAEREALDLLLACLTEEQRREYEADKQFHVVARSGRRYCIKADGYAGNIHRNGRRYCCHAYEEGLPMADHLLAQKLALEHDEDGFLRLANVS